MNAKQKALARGDMDEAARLDAEITALQTERSDAAYARSQSKSTYVVKAGDSWFKIAEALYGDQRMAGALMDANSDFQYLEAGMEIHLPAAPGDPSTPVYFSNDTYKDALNAALGRATAKRVEARQQQLYDEGFYFDDDDEAMLADEVATALVETGLVVPDDADFDPLSTADKQALAEANTALANPPLSAADQVMLDKNARYGFEAGVMPEAQAQPNGAQTTPQAPTATPEGGYDPLNTADKQAAAEADAALAAPPVSAADQKLIDMANRLGLETEEFAEPLSEADQKLADKAERHDFEEKQAEAAKDEKVFESNEAKKDYQAIKEVSDKRREEEERRRQGGRKGLASPVQQTGQPPTEEEKAEAERLMDIWYGAQQADLTLTRSTRPDQPTEQEIMDNIRAKNKWYREAFANGEITLDQVEEFVYEGKDIQEDVEQKIKVRTKPTVVPGERTDTYVIALNDTLTEIVARYQEDSRVREGYTVNIDDILKANGMGSANDLLHVGAKLIIPLSPDWMFTTSVNSNWDYEITLNKGVSNYSEVQKAFFIMNPDAYFPPLQQILDANPGWDDPNNIYVGQVIIIPQTPPEAPKGKATGFEDANQLTIPEYDGNASDPNELEPIFPPWENENDEESFKEPVVVEWNEKRFTIISRSAWGADPVNMEADEETELTMYGEDMGGELNTINVHQSSEYGIELEPPLQSGVDKNGEPIYDYSNQIRQIQNYHMEKNGWADTGYHFFVAPDGTIYEGRDLRVVGANVEDFNTGGIGVVFLGNFDNGEPEDAAKDAFMALMASLTNTFGIQCIGQHNHFNSTGCPGG
ncbi:MAG: LysM peptidoglycan-binding domain-containing protein, partial [Anaerolineae bacterium]|nr:LysM peptidoglycan-binding domain-containing protein [Anaerolineae bacterium]